MPAITLGRYDFDVQWDSSTSTVKGTGVAILKQDSANWSTPTTYNGNSYPCVARGGYYGNDNYFTASRSNGSNTNSRNDLGFRPLLYL
ncbi:MAG: hypothetical protein IKG14_03365 [Clostridia bacterium]|nr:hypothetical protein [Clostridia bacterium]